MSMKLYAAAGAAPAALEMLRAILNTADAKRVFDDQCPLVRESVPTMVELGLPPAPCCNPELSRIP